MGYYKQNMKTNVSQKKIINNMNVTMSKTIMERLADIQRATKELDEYIKSTAGVEELNSYADGLEEARREESDKHKDDDKI